MTTYGEAVQMVFGANLAVGVLNELGCASQALALATLQNIPLLEELEKTNPEFVRALTHISNHLNATRDLAATVDQHMQAELHKFKDENPGKMETIAEEVSNSELLRLMQDAVGMTDEERTAMRVANLRNIQNPGNRLN